jgi:hypothetical protein
VSEPEDQPKPIEYLVDPRDPEQVKRLIETLDLPASEPQPESKLTLAVRIATSIAALIRGGLFRMWWVLHGGPFCLAACEP